MREARDPGAGAQCHGSPSGLLLAPAKRITAEAKGQETLALSCRYGRKEVIVGDEFPKYLAWRIWLYRCSIREDEKAAPAYTREGFGLKDTKKQISERQKSRDRIIDTSESPMYF